MIGAVVIFLLLAVLVSLTRLLILLSKTVDPGIPVGMPELTCRTRCHQ